MTTPLASVDQLEDRLGDVDIDEARIAACLADASALVRAEARQTWLDDAGDLDGVPDVVEMIVLAVARRAYLNPDGAIQQTAGPFTERYAEVAGQVFYLTDTEQRALAKYHDTPGLWAQPTTRGDVESGTVYAEGDGDPIPMFVSPPGTW
jgi:hypothetical protein